MARAVPRGWMLVNKETYSGTGYGDEEFGWHLYRWLKGRDHVSGHLWWKKYEERYRWRLVAVYGDGRGEMERAKEFARLTEEAQPTVIGLDHHPTLATG